MYEPRKLKAAEIRQLPRDVCSTVTALQKRFHTRNARLKIVDPSFQLYLGEGCKYNFFYGDNTASVKMQAQHSLHAGAPRTSYRVGERVLLPQGTWVVEFELF